MTPARPATVPLALPPKRRARDRGRAGMTPARPATARSEFSPRPSRSTPAMRCNAGRRVGSRCRLRSPRKVGSKIRPSSPPGRASFSIRRPSRRSGNGGSGRRWSMASRYRLWRLRKSGLRCPAERSSGKPHPSACSANSRDYFSIPTPRHPIFRHSFAPWKAGLAAIVPSRVQSYPPGHLSGSWGPPQPRRFFLFHAHLVRPFPANIEPSRSRRWRAEET